MQGKYERLKAKLDSTQLVNSKLILNRDSLIAAVGDFETFRILKEAIVLMSSWNWSEAEIKLINIIRDHPNSSEADEAIKLIEIIKAELLKLDTKPISYKDVLRGDLEKFRKIERELIGRKYIAPFSLGIIEKYGFPETQVGTSNNIWVAYFPIGRFTIYMNKRNDEIVKV